MTILALAAIVWCVLLFIVLSMCAVSGRFSRAEELREAETQERETIQ